jgi:hypothetical protein
MVFLEVAFVEEGADEETEVGSRNREKRKKTGKREKTCKRQHRREGDQLFIPCRYSATLKLRTSLSSSHGLMQSFSLSNPAIIYPEIGC